MCLTMECYHDNIINVLRSEYSFASVNLKYLKTKNSIANNSGFDNIKLILYKVNYKTLAFY